MKRVLSIILSVTLVLSLSTFTAFAGNGNGKDKDNGHGYKVAKEFKDTKGHWGQKSIERIRSKGILEGYSDGTFLPDKAITEAELAVIIDRLLEARMSHDDNWIGEDGKFDTDAWELTDVPAWAKYSVLKGFEKKYLNHKRFHSHVQASRLTACVAIAKALDLEPVTDFYFNPFKDRKLMNNEDYGYLLALYKGGYISGYPDGNFNPNKLITRVQIAIIIEKLLDDRLASDDETAPTWDNDAELTAEDVEATSLKLEWSGAEDDVKVTGYKIILKIDDKTKTRYVSGTTAMVGNLEPDTKYKFTVEARDAAGNWSDDGPSVTVTTLKKTVADTEDPTWPDDADLDISELDGVVTVRWPDAEDNVGVTAYKVYKDGQLYKTLDDDVNKVRISGLDEDTEYTFKVRAVDAAGNLSDSLEDTYTTD